MTKMTRACLCLIFFSFVIAFTAAAADTPVATLRQLYMAAEYDNALTALEAIDLKTLAAPERLQVEGFHAACLVALGRNDDAERVMETIVRLDPHTVQPVDSSPKLRALFARVRVRVLRVVVRERYAQAKSLYDNKQFDEAQSAFEDVVSLLAPSGATSSSEDVTMDDVRTLAAEFADLAKAGAERNRPAPEPTPPPTPVPAATPPPPPAPAAPASPSTPAIYSAADTDVLPPVTLSQQLQLTAGAARIAASRAPLIVYVVALISEKGLVEQASLSRPIDPVIDEALLASAKRWQYRPAQRNGVPVKYSKTVRLDLK
jgi:hypothetical protein